jgi:phospholipid/cholesterol/gamma-HCH transport system permease protein
MPSSPYPTAMQPVLMLGRIGFFARAVGASLLTGRWSPREALQHASTLATRCFIPVNVTIFPFGAAMGLQGMQIFDLFSAHRLVSTLLAQFVIQELGPVLAAVLVAAQAGSSFAAELGTMRIKEEIDATEVMAVDAVGWHVAPRLLALAAVMPPLVIIANFFGIFGSYCVAVGLYDQPHGVFMAHLCENIGSYDLLCSAFKGLFFGLLIGLIATFKGFYATGGAAGVGRAVNDTVVWSVMYILMFNYLLSSLMFSGAW